MRFKLPNIGFIFVTSAFCFSQMMAYWPMWLSKLMTLLFSWNTGRSRENTNKTHPLWLQSQFNSVKINSSNLWWFKACCWTGGTAETACMCGPYSGFDLFCTVGIFESVVRVFVGERGRADVSDHHSSAVSTQRVFEKPCQLAISVRNVRLLTLRTQKTTTNSKDDSKNIIKGHRRDRGNME